MTTGTTEAEPIPLFNAYFDDERRAVIVSGMALKDQRIISSPGFGLGSYVVSHERLSDPDEDSAERKHPTYRSIAKQNFKLPEVNGIKLEVGSSGKIDWIIGVDDKDAAHTVMGWVGQTFAAVYADRAKSELNLKNPL